MSNVIQYLDALARHPYGMGARQAEEALAGIPDEARAAIVAGDVRSLGGLLGARSAMACMVVAPDSEEPSPEDAPGDGGDAPDSPDEQEIRAA